MNREKGKHMGDLGVDGWVWTGFIWLRIRSSGGLLRTQELTFWFNKNNFLTSYGTISF
jgi:hypothetical protein